MLRKNEKKFRQTFKFIIVCSFLLNILLNGGVSGLDSLKLGGNDIKAEAAETVLFNDEPIESLEELSAASHILIEVESGRVISGKDIHEKRAMASTTKLMTALLGAERLELDKEITVKTEQINVEGSSLYLKDGDQINIKDLLTGLILKSGNDAANVVAYTVGGSIPDFVKLMNERALEIGMKNTIFVTPSGLDEGEHSSTAYDMALLGREVLKNKTVAEICATEKTTIKFGNPPVDVVIKNGNRLLTLYENAVGMKTGFTQKAKRCLVSAAEKDGVQLVAVTLNAGDDWNDHIKLFEHGFSLTERVKLNVSKVDEIKVGGGKQDRVKLDYDVITELTLLKTEGQKLSHETILPKFVIAPIKKGDYIGEVRYNIGGELFMKTDIVAAEDVAGRPKANGFVLFWRNFRKLAGFIFN